MGETIGDMDKKIEQKDKKLSLLADKIGITDDKVVEEVNKLDFNKISKKCDRNNFKINKTLNFHKKNKNYKNLQL